MKRNRKNLNGKGNEEPKTSRGDKGNISRLPKLGRPQVEETEMTSTGEHVLCARVESEASLPAVTQSNRRDSSPRQKVYIYNNTKPVHLRLRTPSPERRRKHLSSMDKADANSKSTLSQLMEDLNILRNTRAKMEEREILKYQNRFTELPTPVYNPPPKGMPRNNEIVQRVLDRRDIGQAAILHRDSRTMPFDMRLLRMIYDAPTEIAVQAGGWGFGASSLAPYPAGSQSTLEDHGNGEVSMALESVADSLIGVAQSLIDSVFLNDSWRFFRRTGGNGVEWTMEESLNRRKLLPNPFGCLTIAAYHEAGRWTPALDFTKFEITDDILIEASEMNPTFIILNLKGQVGLSPSAIRQAIAFRGRGLQSLDLSNGVRSCRDVFKPLAEGSQVIDDRVSEGLASLITLSLNRCPGFCSSLLSHVALRCTNLRELDVSYNNDGTMNDTGLRWLAAACPTLQKLKIDRSVTVSDVGMRTLVTRCTRLAHLHASFCPLICGKFFLIVPAHEKAPSRVVVKCRQLQLLDLSHCEDLDPFVLSWAGSSASRLRHVNVRGTPAIADGAALFALCSCTKGMERLIIDSAKPAAHRRLTSLDYGQDQDEGPCAEEAPHVFGHRGRPLSSHALITALCELPMNRGLLELECDDLTDRDLLTLLKQQGKILRVLKLKHAVHLVGNKAFEPFTHVVDLHELAHKAVHKERMVNREGEEAPCVEGDLVLGELQVLELGCVHKLKAVTFIHLAQLQLPNLKSLSISGLRGGGNRFTGELSALIKEVGSHLESLTLEDMIINDALAGAIAEGCRPRYVSSNASAGASVSSGGSHPSQLDVFAALGAQSAPKPPTKKKRQYTTINDLPKLTYLSLEYVRDPQRLIDEERLDRPKKTRNHLKQEHIQRNEHGLNDAQSEFTDPFDSEPGTPATGVSFHEHDFDTELPVEPMSSKSILESEASFSEYSDMGSDISATRSARKSRGLKRSKAARVDLSKYGGMTDIGLALIVSSVGSCLKSVKVLGFNAVSGVKVFDLPGAVGVQGIGKKQKKAIKQTSSGIASPDTGYLSSDVDGMDSDTLSRLSSVEATPLRATTRTASRIHTRPASAKKLSFTPEVMSPKPDLNSPLRFSGMPAGILKTSSNMTMPKLMATSRIEFSNRRDAAEFMQRKHADEQETASAGLRCYSMTNAPNFAISHDILGSEVEGAKGRKKHRYRRAQKGSHSVSSGGSRLRNQSDHTSDHDYSSGSDLTEGKVHKHNKLMAKEHSPKPTHMSLRKKASVGSPSELCAVEALSLEEDGGSFHEESLSPRGKKQLSRERKALARQAQKRTATMNKQQNENERNRVRAAAPGWSLPALKEIAIVGCKNFSVKALNRLVANTPQLRRLDATDCRYLVSRVGKAKDDLNSVGEEAWPGNGASQPSSTASVKSGTSVIGSLKSFNGSRRRKKMKVDWAELCHRLPYCRPAPLNKGLSPAPDADALAWRDAYIERKALEKRACRTVMNCFRSFKFRRVYIVRHAAFVLTKFWKTFNIGMLKVLRLHWKVSKKRRLRRQFFLNLYSALNAGRLLRRVARGALARARTRTLLNKMMFAATKIQRMVRAYFDWHAYFIEVTKKALQEVIEDERYGFDMPVKFHHKLPYSEAKQLHRVKQIPLLDYSAPAPKLTIDGRVAFDEHRSCTGTGFTGDMDVRRAFRAENADIYSTGEDKPQKKQPLAMPARPKSYYT